MITTETFKIDPSALAAEIIKLWLKRNYPLLLIAPIACLIAAVWFDIKFLLVSLVVIFLIIPPVILIVYYYHALAPEARFSILEHHVLLTNDGINIIYDGENSKNAEIIPWSDISTMHISPTKITYKFRKSTYIIMQIPLSSLQNPEKIRECIFFSNKMLQKFA